MQRCVASSKYRRTCSPDAPPSPRVPDDYDSRIARDARDRARDAYCMRWVLLWQVYPAGFKGGTHRGKSSSRKRTFKNQCHIHSSEGLLEGGDVHPPAPSCSWQGTRTSLYTASKRMCSGKATENMRKRRKIPAKFAQRRAETSQGRDSDEPIGSLPNGTVRAGAAAQKRHRSKRYREKKVRKRTRGDRTNCRRAERTRGTKYTQQSLRRVESLALVAGAANICRRASCHRRR